MPTPDHIRQKSIEKRKRVCRICGKEFLVRSADRVGAACSKPCLSEVNRNNALGRKHSAETRAKMSKGQRLWMEANPEAAAKRAAQGRESLLAWNATEEKARIASERMKCLHQDPKFQKRRDARSSQTLKRTWAARREHMLKLTLDRSKKQQEAGTGIFSEESEQRKRRAAKWILSRAHEALCNETEFTTVMSRMQKHFRAEFPFLGGDQEDYFEYLKEIDRMVLHSPEVRELVDSFMSEAVPRFSKEWRDGKGGEE